MNTSSVFKKIIDDCQEYCKYSSDVSCNLAGDSLEVLKSIPSHSIALILTDPPYHTTKKKNIYGDTFFREDAEYLSWIAEYAKEWKRVLKPNGSVFCFCSAAMSAKLEAVFSSEFNILSQIVWTKPNAPGFDGWKQKMKKEALRQWYAHTERIIFLEPAVEGNLNRSFFGDFLRNARKELSITTNALTEMVGAYGKVNHGGAVSNWEAGRNVPSREQYDRLCEAFYQRGRTEPMPAYEDIIRPFCVNKNMEFTDVWTFENIRPYKGKHPAEKPVKMLEHAILATTYEGDIVLDCFAGSGSTAVAALKNNRRSVSIEIDEQWTAQITALLQHLNGLANGEYPDNYNEALLQAPPDQMAFKL
jgi:site-specific DNA-methyltransferase (adenine-specific)